MVHAHKPIRRGNKWARVEGHNRTENGDMHRGHGICSYYIQHRNARLTIYAKIHNCPSKRAAYWSRHKRRRG